MEESALVSGSLIGRLMLLCPKCRAEYFGMEENTPNNLYNSLEAQLAMALQEIEHLKNHLKNKEMK